MSLKGVWRGLVSQSHFVSVDRLRAVLIGTPRLGVFPSLFVSHSEVCWHYWAGKRSEDTPFVALPGKRRPGELIKKTKKKALGDTMKEPARGGGPTEQQSSDRFFKSWA